MKIVAHRGSMRRDRQNSPEGVRLALLAGADQVELDVVRERDGGVSFHCAHGFGRRFPLGSCLGEMGGSMGLILHLKGRFTDADLDRLLPEVLCHLPMERVCFATHRAALMRRLSERLPSASLARFGFLPALLALRRHRKLGYCLVNQVLLPKWLVAGLQRRGYRVYASCVWEWRSRRALQRLGVDGLFVNLR